MYKPYCKYFFFLFEIQNVLLIFLNTLFVKKMLNYHAAKGWIKLDDVIPLRDKVADWNELDPETFIKT